MKLKTQFRFIDIDRASVNTEDRTVDLSFSSETPVDQWFGREVLSHEPGAVDMSRLDSGAPLLWNHNSSDVRGVVEHAKIGPDKRGVAKVRFARTVAGDEAMSMVKDGIVRGVSVGYRIMAMDEGRGAKGGDKEYTVTRWMPQEISLAPVPADHTIGIGRSDLETERDVAIKPLETPSVPAAPATRSQTMSEAEQTAALEAARKAAGVDAAKAERSRISEITGWGEKFGKADLARKLVDDGAPTDAARAAFMEALGAVQQPVASGGNAGNLDLSPTEQKQYSLIRAIAASMSGNWKGAGFELECSQAIAKRANRETTGFFMPSDIPIDAAMANAARAMAAQRTTSATAYAATLGTNGTASMIATNLLAGSFIEVLRNKARVMSLGARMLTGLVGNVTIPRQDTASSAYWISPEGSDITESEATFDLISMTPRTLGAYSMMTRQMMMQSTPDIEMLVREDLAAVMALAVDLGCISGTGANGQPTGILNHSGIQSVPLGTNGGPITFDALVALETLLTEQNVDETNLAYLTNAKLIGELKLLKDTTGRYLWTQYTGNSFPATGTPGEVNGYKVARSNQVASNLTKGTGTGLSAVIFANWSELIIGEWGVMEIVPNPYGAGFKSGSIEIRAMQSLDINLRHPVSFAAITDAS